MIRSVRIIKSLPIWYKFNEFMRLREYSKAVDVIYMIYECFNFPIFSESMIPTASARFSFAFFKAGMPEYAERLCRVVLSAVDKNDGIYSKKYNKDQLVYLSLHANYILTYIQDGESEAEISKLKKIYAGINLKNVGSRIMDELPLDHDFLRS